MIELKTPREIEEMKPAGRFVGGILKELQETTKVGTNLLEIDEFVHKKIVDRKGAESCYVDYAPDFGTGPFAHYICTSVNDAVLHGVPYDYSLKDGDLVSLDLAISVDGWVADSAVSFVVGKDPTPKTCASSSALRKRSPPPSTWPSPATVSATSPTPSATSRANTATRSTSSSAVTAWATSCTATRTPNDGRAHHGYKLREGLVIAIEPWFLKTTDEIFQDPKDGWTPACLRTARAAPNSSTPSPSPRTARSSSPIAPTSDRRLAYGRCLIGL